MSDFEKVIKDKQDIDHELNNIAQNIIDCENNITCNICGNQKGITGSPEENAQRIYNDGWRFEPFDYGINDGDMGNWCPECIREEIGDILDQIV